MGTSDDNNTTANYFNGPIDAAGCAFGAGSVVNNYAGPPPAGTGEDDSSSAPAAVNTTTNRFLGDVIINAPTDL